MKLEQKVMYILELDHEELLIVSKALGNRISTEAQATKANTLDNEIATRRVQIAEHTAEEMQKLKANLRQEDYRQ